MRPAPHLAVYREGVTLLVLDGRAPVSDGLFGGRQLWEVLAGHLYLHSARHLDGSWVLSDRGHKVFHRGYEERYARER